MWVMGALLALFGGGGLVSAVFRYLDGRHVEPIGIGLLALMFLGGLLLVFLGSARAHAMTRLGSELAVLKVAERHGGRVTPVLVAEEARIPVAVAERELASLAERGACVRSAEDDRSGYLFPELESEEVKRKLFFAENARRARGQKVTP